MVLIGGTNNALGTGLQPVGRHPQRVLIARVWTGKREGTPVLLRQIVKNLRVKLRPEDK